MTIQPFYCYYLFADSLSNKKFFNGEENVVSTINPFSFLVAEKNVIFKKALLNSDILIADGIGIVWAVKFLYNRKIQKIAGYDLLIYLMKVLNNEKGKVFFLGSTNETLEKIKKKCLLDYPNITVETYSPPFKEELSDEDNELIFRRIKLFKPDVLFVGMTAPKQEIWVYKNKAYLDVKTIASIGAVFDFYAGNEKRANSFLLKLGLEWLIRSIQSPKRLGKRNLYAIPRFLIKIIKLKIFR
ncbi:MAG: WecB/TagA/CpsF family glycosyltransferase [bacterium]